MLKPTEPPRYPNILGFFIGNFILAFFHVALELPGETIKSCESRTFFSFPNIYTFYFSCVIAFVEIFGTMLNNGYNGGTDELPSFGRNVSSISVLSKNPVLHFLCQPGDVTNIRG